MLLVCCSNILTSCGIDPDEYCREVVSVGDGYTYYIIHNYKCPVYTPSMFEGDKKQDYRKQTYHVYCKYCWSKYDVKKMNAMSIANYYSAKASAELMFTYVYKEIKAGIKDYYDVPDDEDYWKFPSDDITRRDFDCKHARKYIDGKIVLKVIDKKQLTTPEKEEKYREYIHNLYRKYGNEYYLYKYN